MNNGRFAISVHILTLLATAEDEWTSSEWLAGSININPVLVRKELVNLRNRGFVASKEGKNGGSKLGKPADQIMMSEVYVAVREEHFLGLAKNRPNPACPVGRQIEHHLQHLYDEAETMLVKGLEEKSLAQFCQNFI